MIKKLLIVFLVLIVVGVAAVAYFFSSLVNDGIVTGVNEYGPRFTQTAVTLDSADISVLGGSGTLSGFFIGNPKGFTGDKAFYLGEVSVDLDVKSLMSDQILIHKIHIKSPEINFEQTLSGNNLKTIQKNIQKVSQATQAAQADPAETTETESEGGKKVIIEQFIVEGGVVDVTLLGQSLSVPIPRMELNNIGKEEGGITTVEAATLFTTELINNVIAAVGDASGDFNKVGGDIGKQVDEVKDKAEEVIGGLKKLF